MTDKEAFESFEAWWIASPHSKNLYPVGTVRYAHANGMAAFEAWQAATLAERERCAKVCETWAKGHAKADGCTYSDCHFVAAAQDCAAAIRALPDGGT